MSKKTFKNLDEQIEILKSKGLIINDIDRAKEILFRENYFFVSGYRHLFQNKNRDNVFLPGTTFEELYGTFVFDRNIRNIMFKFILIVENNVKSIISYQMSKKYGYKEKDYLNPKNFVQDNMKVRQVYDVLNKMKRQIRINGKQHAATSHYIMNYGYIPMWILVKVLSFGIITELYGILKPDDRINIAEIYHTNPETLSTYLAILANFRNLCAHEDILYDHRTQRCIPDSKFHYQLDIPVVDDQYIYGKNDLFAVMIIFKIMLTEDEFRDMMNQISYEIDILDGKVDTVPVEQILNKIGFPTNFREILDINKDY